MQLISLLIKVEAKATTRKWQLFKEETKCEEVAKDMGVQYSKADCANVCDIAGYDIFSYYGTAIRSGKEPILKCLCHSEGCATVQARGFHLYKFEGGKITFYQETFIRGTKRKFTYNISSKRGR